METDRSANSSDDRRTTGGAGVTPTAGEPLTKETAGEGGKQMVLARARRRLAVWDGLVE